MKWTNSESNIFGQCRRKYFLSEYVASHNSYERLRRKAFELKNVQTFEMWQGTVVDKAIAQFVIPAINRKEELDFEQFADQAVALAKTQFDFSAQGLYKTVSKTEAGSNYCILDVHALLKPYTQESLGQVYSTIREALQNLPRIKMPNSQDTLLSFLQGAYALYPDVTNRRFKVEEAFVNPQIDLIATVNYKPVVIDWKVSHSLTSDYSRQLLIIGLVIFHTRLKNEEKRPYRYGDIRLLEVNLIKDGGFVQEHAFTEERVNQLYDDIYLSSEDMGTILKGRKYRQLSPEDFPMTESQYACENCAFYPLCMHLYQNNNQYDEAKYAQSIHDYQCK